LHPVRASAPVSPKRLAIAVFFIIVEQVLNGLVVGAYYILLAMGLSVVFSLGGVVNLAHGAFYALGAYLAVSIANDGGFYGALIGAPVIVALVGMVIEVLFLRRLYKEDAILGLLFTFGLALTAEQALRLIWGVTGLPFSIPPSLAGVLRTGGFLFSNYRLAILAIAVATIAATWLLLNRTSFGMVVRAGTSDPEMVRALGIRLRPVLTIIFGLGVGIAGLAGVVSAPLAGVDTYPPPARRRHQRGPAAQIGLAVRDAGHAPRLHRLGALRGEPPVSGRQRPRLWRRPPVGTASRRAGATARPRPVWIMRRAHGRALQPGARSNSSCLCVPGDGGPPWRKALPNGSWQGPRSGGRCPAGRADDADDPGGHPGSPA